MSWALDNSECPSCGEYSLYDVLTTSHNFCCPCCSALLRIEESRVSDGDGGYEPYAEVIETCVESV